MKIVSPGVAKDDVTKAKPAAALRVQVIDLFIFTSPIVSRLLQLSDTYELEYQEWHPVTTEISSPITSGAGK
jgi:hypothetical protein